MSRSVMFLCLLMVFAPLELTAQTATKFQVYIAHSGDDTVGRRVAYAIREEVRRSAAYSLSSTYADSAIQVRLVSVDLALPSESTGIWSAVAVTLTLTNNLPFDSRNPQTWLPIYLHSSIFVVGRNRIEPKAKDIVAWLDEQVEEYRAVIKP